MTYRGVSFEVGRAMAPLRKAHRMREANEAKPEHREIQEKSGEVCARIGVGKLAKSCRKHGGVRHRRLQQK